MRGWTHGRVDPLGLVGEEEAHLERKSHEIRGKAGAELPSLWISAASNQREAGVGGSAGDLCHVMGLCVPFFIPCAAEIAL